MAVFPLFLKNLALSLWVEFMLLRGGGHSQRTWNVTVHMVYHSNRFQILVSSKNNVFPFTIKNVI